jgi:hypothetical protein
MAGNADNILIGAAQISLGIVDLGYTKGGVRLRYEPTFVEVEADQAVGVVKRGRANERFYIVTTLIELTLENLRIAFMLPSASLSGSTLTLGYNNSCWVDEHTLTLVGEAPECATRTVTITRAITFNNKEYNMQRDEESGIEVEFECLKDVNGEFGTIVDT